MLNRPEKARTVPRKAGAPLEPLLLGRLVARCVRIVVSEKEVLNMLVNLV